MGTPLCIPTKEYIDIGKIASIEINHKQVDMATKGQKVAIKVGISDNLWLLILLLFNYIVKYMFAGM